MRRLLIVLALLPASAFAAGQDPEVKPAPPTAAPGTKVCQNPDLQRVTRDQQPVQPRTLEREPPADAYYTVMRIEDGCDKPVLVRDRR